MATSEKPQRWTLYDAPFAAKLAIAAFLISAGLGYASALVNLHFQEATPGKALPDDDDVVRAYSGKDKASQLERLLIAHPSLPFNGEGSMRRVFLAPKVKASDKKLKELAKRMGLADPNDPKVYKEAKVVDRFWKEIDGERLALIAWLQQEDKKAVKDAYEADELKLDGKLNGLVINPEFIAHGDPKAEKEEDKVSKAKVKSILEARCVSCHSAGVGGPASRYPLEDWEEVSAYTVPERKGKSLSKLALTTHVHLLGFSMLYGLSGLLLALTPLPGWLRVPLAPLPLVAQVVDISFWWLARLDDPHGPMFAKLIIVSGGVVAVSFGSQIVLTMISMFGRFGKGLLIVLFALMIGGAVGLKPKFLDPFLAKERDAMNAVEEKKDDKPKEGE